MIQELRHYVAAEERSQELLQRFQRLTLPLFRSLGFQVVGFWQETDRADHFWYLLSWTDEAAMRAGWQRLRGSPEWQRIKSETEADGPLVSQITSRTLTCRDDPFRTD